MRPKFLHFLNANAIPTTDKLLVAVSGGVDSVVLCHLCKDANLTFGMAHFNYQLRGADSNADEQFVSTLATKLEVPIHTETANTKLLAKQQKAGTQELARTLRYNWFDRLVADHNYQWILTAHHLNDSIETILLNLTKGTGIKGMGGIPKINKNILRPLTDCSRSEIEAFAKTNNIEFREDTSNKKDTYQRNYIRHHIVPAMKHLNPSLENTFLGNRKRFQDIAIIYQQFIDSKISMLLNEEAGVWKVSIKQLLNEVSKETILYEIIQQFGFNNTFIDPILKASSSTESKQFFSPTHRLVVNRSEIAIVRFSDVKETEPLQIEKIPHTVQVEDKTFQFVYLEEIPESFDQGSHIALLNADAINLPLTLRKWQNGDEFQPLGLKGKHKKISDLYNEHKLSVLEKESQWILDSKHGICWVVGLRVAHPFRLHKSSNRVIKVSVINTI